MYFRHQRKNVVDRGGCSKKLRLEILENRRMLATMRVTNLDDGSLASLAGDGELSLREAVEAINTAAPVDGIGPVSGVFGVGDTIAIPASLFGGTPQTLALTAGQLELASGVTISGPDGKLLTIDAQENSRIFDITTVADEDFVFRQLVLSGGKTTGNDERGGAIRSQSSGQVRVENLELTGNGTTGNFSNGGAISAEGFVNVINTTIADNYTEGSGGSGGGIFTMGDVNLTRSTIANNRTEGTFASGGGVSSFAFVTLNNSTVSGNRTLGSASSAGGVLGIAGVEMTESTVSGNQTTGNTSSAGGISSSGPITITRSTIVDNRTQGGSAPGGGLLVTDTDISVTGSIIADNSAGGGSNDIEPGTGNLSVEFSLIGDASGLGIAAATNVLNQDPLLGALADNGGLTETHALLTGSPAIDAGDPSIASPPLFDQREIPFRRIRDGDGNGSFIIDMGSYELQAPDQANPDFDDDNDVDGTDFLRWQLGFGTMSGASPGDGDSDGDGDVDDDDLSNWSSQYGSGALQPVSASSDSLASIVDAAIAVELSEPGQPEAGSASIFQPLSAEGDSSRDQAFASIVTSAATSETHDVADVGESQSDANIDLALEEQLVVTAL